jgi:hypothetical protein
MYLDISRLCTIYSGSIQHGQIEHSAQQEGAAMQAMQPYECSPIQIIMGEH